METGPSSHRVDHRFTLVVCNAAFSSTPCTLGTIFIEGQLTYSPAHFLDVEGNPRGHRENVQTLHTGENPRLGSNPGHWRHEAVALPAVLVKVSTKVQMQQ